MSTSISAGNSFLYHFLAVPFTIFLPRFCSLIRKVRSWNFFCFLQLFKHTLCNIFIKTGCRTSCLTDLQHLYCKALYWCYLWAWFFQINRKGRLENKTQTSILYTTALYDENFKLQMITDSY